MVVLIDSQISDFTDGFMGYIQFNSTLFVQPNITTIVVSTDFIINMKSTIFLFLERRLFNKDIIVKNCQRQKSSTKKKKKVSESHDSMFCFDRGKYPSYATSFVICTVMKVH